MPSLWKKTYSLPELNSKNPNTIHASLGIEFTAIGDEFLEATMPVDPRTHQASGLLHGGASGVLAESLGSIASVLHAGIEKTCVGIELSASHLNAVTSGFVTGRVTPIRLGRSLHVWRIQITDQGRPICECRLTVLVR